MSAHLYFKMKCLVAAAIVLSAVAAGTVLAQQGGPAQPNTNPAGHVIFPAKDQAAAQQAKDQADACAWATQQTGWDPNVAHAQMVQQGNMAGKTSEATKGRVFKGAGRGAVLGLAIGAIVDEAGKGAAIGATAGGLTSGMRSRSIKKSAQSSAQASQDAYKKQLANWDRYFVAAMEGKGYIVK